MHRNTTIVLTLLLFLTIVIPSADSAAQGLSVNAQAGFLLDYNSGQVLFTQEGDTPWIPASLVKVMTMYVALDSIAEGSLALGDTVVVSERAWRMGGSQMFIEVGERVSVEQLLYGIAVVSGNDACIAIAEAVAGSEEVFVQWMNKKAQDLGLSLRFADVHGLSENNQVTARDMAKLVYHYITDHPDALKYHQERSFGYQPRSQSEPIVQSNRNRLLWQFDGADGLKTGYLRSAAYNLIATAEQDGRRMIAIILGANSERVREEEASKLLNYGFRSFELVPLVDLLPGDSERVYKGRERSVSYRPAEDGVTVPRGRADSIVVEISSGSVVAPVTAGSVIGEMVISLDDEVVKRTTLLAAEDVERGSLFRVILDSIILFITGLFER